ncbi:PilN domain-containing protein [Pseudovibrio denitrificans]|uniref:PilN domain-containing protein n=1 Tax=Pseudovibrio denitrificans TaxID=258256 RepID=UPI0013E40032|nr:PilN domain-containing protein [Pseudovibrio denitrificans]
MRLTKLTAIEQFFLWWFFELASVGREIKAKLGFNEKSNHILFVSPNQEAHGKHSDFRFEIFDIKLGTSTPFIDWTQFKGREVDLVLAPQLCLNLKENFPIANDEHLSNAIDLYVKQNTPFNESTASWTWSASSKQFSSIHVDISLVKQSISSNIIEICKKKELEISNIFTQNSDTHKLINLLKLETSQQVRVKFWRKVNLVLFGFIIAILLAAHFSYTKAHDTALIVLSEKLTDVKRKAVRQKKERLKAEEELNRRLSLSRHKGQHRSVLAIWEDLSQNMPETAWLNEFYLEEDQGRIAGFAASAASLLATLDQLEGLSQVSFNSPVTINPTDRLERFDISFTIQRNDEQ